MIDTDLGLEPVFGPAFRGRSHAGIVDENIECRTLREERGSALANAFK